MTFLIKSGQVGGLDKNMSFDSINHDECIYSSTDDRSSAILAA